MKILVINGPNINMIGNREKYIYVTISYQRIVQLIVQEGKKRNMEITCVQSNYEGDLVTWIQDAYFEKYDGIVINPGAYTHTSIALLDAVKAIAPMPVVEVHLSKVSEREDFRQISYISKACIKTIQGKKELGYIEALDVLLDYYRDREL